MCRCLCVNSLVTVSVWSLILALRCRRPLLSVWSVPHRLGTFSTHRLWIFIMQSAEKPHGVRLTASHMRRLLRALWRRTRTCPRKHRRHECTHTHEKHTQRSHPNWPHHVQHTWLGTINRCGYSSFSMFKTHTKRFQAIEILASPICFSN